MHVPRTALQGMFDEEIDPSLAADIEGQVSSACRLERISAMLLCMDIKTGNGPKLQSSESIYGSFASNEPELA